MGGVSKTLFQLATFSMCPPYGSFKTMGGVSKHDLGGGRVGGGSVQISLWRDIPPERILDALFGESEKGPQKGSQKGPNCGVNPEQEWGTCLSWEREAREGSESRTQAVEHETRSCCEAAQPRT